MKIEDLKGAKRFTINCFVDTFFQARRALGDFGVPIAIVLMSCAGLSIDQTVFIEKLNVPQGKNLSIYS